METITDLPLIVIVLASVSMLVGGFVHGTLGLGFPMVVTPLLALLVDVKTAILLTLLPTAVVNIASLVRDSGWLDSLKQYWVLAFFSVLGSSLGAALIANTDPTPFQLLLALLMILFLISDHLTPNAFAFLSVRPVAGMVGVGLVAGFAAGTTNVMVPILIIYSLSLSLSKNSTVQMFNLCFLCGKLSQMVVFAGTGLISMTLLISTVPFAIAGYATLLMGQRIRDVIPTEFFRKIVRAILLLLALILLLQGLYAYTIKS